MKLFPLLVPPGNDTEVMFNDGGLFAGDSTFTFNKTTKILDIDGQTITGTTAIGLDMSSGTFATAIQKWPAGTIQSTGDIVFQPTSDGTTRYQWLNAAGDATVFKIDTTNKRLYATGVGEVAIFGPSSFSDVYISFRDSANFGPKVGLQISQFMSDALDTTTGQYLIRAGGGRGFAVSVNDSTAFSDIDTAAFVITKNGFAGFGTVDPQGPIDATGSGASIFQRELDPGVLSLPISAVQFGLTGGTMAAGGGPSFLLFADNDAGDMEFMGRLSAVWENPADGAETSAIILSVRANTGDTTASTEVIRGTSAGFIGIGPETDPETLLELTHAQPYITLQNATHENLLRESKLIGKGNKLDQTEHTLASWQFSHDGTGDDFLGQIVGAVNANGGADTLVDAIIIDSKGIISEIGPFFLKETTTPTALPGYGVLYTKNTNTLWFQDGSGVEHLLHGDAFSNIWFHDKDTVEVAISTQNAFTIVDSFTVVGHEDDLTNVVGSSASNTLTLASVAGGEYEVSYHASATATGGADKEMLFVLGITLATPKDITDVTDDTVTPIVITTGAHGLENGDMVEIVGVLVNTAANGSFIVDSKTDDTFEIVKLDGSATTGNGDYNEGSPTGDITIEYPGNMIVHRMVRGADLGAMSATGFHILAGSDVLAVYVANVSGVTNLTIAAVSFSANRIGD